MGKLNGKVALITGGTSGIGLATAQKFVEEGAYVYITGRRSSELEKAKALLGKSATAVQGDISKLEDLDQLYKTIKAEKGSLDIIVANAGTVEMVTLAASTPEHFDRTFDTNVRGTFFTVQKSLPLLNKGASIVLISSCVTAKGIPPYTAYAASKAAVRSFGRSWAAELKDRSIRVNTISPGPFETPIIDAQFKTKEEGQQFRAGFSSQVPLGRFGEPEELAKAALYLASDDSSFVTGIDLVVDGGLTQL